MGSATHFCEYCWLACWTCNINHLAFFILSLYMLSLVACAWGTWGL
jgi:hypothetical protein